MKACLKWVIGTASKPAKKATKSPKKTKAVKPKKTPKKK